MKHIFFVTLIASFSISSAFADIERCDLSLQAIVSQKSKAAITEILRDKGYNVYQDYSDQLERESYIYVQVGPNYGYSRDERNSKKFDITPDVWLITDFQNSTCKDEGLRYDRTDRYIVEENFQKAIKVRPKNDESPDSTPRTKRVTERLTRKAIRYFENKFPTCTEMKRFYEKHCL